MQKIFKETQAGTPEAPLASLPVSADNHLSLEDTWEMNPHLEPRPAPGSLTPRVKKRQSLSKPWTKTQSPWFPVSPEHLFQTASTPLNRQTKWQSLSWCWTTALRLHTVPTRPGHQHVQGNGNQSTHQWELHGNCWLLVQPVQCSVKLRMDMLQFLKCSKTNMTSGVWAHIHITRMISGV